MKMTLNNRYSNNAYEDRAWNEAIEDFSTIAQYDHSVSVPGIGSVFHYTPDSSLGAMQQAIANAYHVPFAYMSPNGTTAANVLSLVTMTKPGGKVLCQRDSHISIFAPMIVSDLTPVYVEPTYIPHLGLCTGLSPEQLTAALDKNPDVEAVFLTYPNYFGIACDISVCADIVADRNIPLIIDAAHGAHFGFHSALPTPAQATKASIITQSTHKTCAALNQGSLILFNHMENVAPFYRTANNLGYFSTSFSYLILLSISMAVTQLSCQGEELLGASIEVANGVREQINRIDGLHSFGIEEKTDGFHEFDPMRVTVNVARTGLTGFEFEDILIEEFKIYPEMATLHNILFLFTMADTTKDGQRVVDALQTITKRYVLTTPSPYPAPPPAPGQIVSPRQAYFAPRHRMAAEKSIGQISAETIACYPPGSAIIVAGEEITVEVIEYLVEARARGAVLKGASDPEFKKIECITA